jgi:hypothetical protein
MVVYGIAAFIYRIFIMFVIILFIAGKFFLIGVLLAIWALATQVVVPVGKSASFLATSPVLRRQRGRVLGISVLAVVALLALLFALPVPSWTRAQGVVWVPEEAQVRAGTEGFIERLLVPVDSDVVRGQPLIEARDPFLLTRVAVLTAQLRELSAQYDALVIEDRVQAAMVREEMASVAANLQRSREREAELIFRSPANGRFVAPNAAFPRALVMASSCLRRRAERLHGAGRGSADALPRRQRTRSVEVMLAGWGCPWRGIAAKCREAHGSCRRRRSAAPAAAPSPSILATRKASPRWDGFSSWSSHCPPTCGPPTSVHGFSCVSIRVLNLWGSRYTARSGSCC